MKSPAELAEQGIIVQAFNDVRKHRGIDYVILAVMNEGKRTKHRGALAKWAGMLPGMTDLVVMASPPENAAFAEMGLPTFKGMCIETKVASWKAPRAPKPGRKPSKAYIQHQRQVRVHVRLRAVGYWVDFCPGARYALQQARFLGYEVAVPARVA